MKEAKFSGLILTSKANIIHGSLLLIKYQKKHMQSKQNRILNYEIDDFFFFHTKYNDSFKFDRKKDFFSILQYIYYRK